MLVFVLPISLPIGFEIANKRFQVEIITINRAFIDALTPEVEEETESVSPEEQAAAEAAAQRAAQEAERQREAERRHSQTDWDDGRSRN